MRKISQQVIGFLLEDSGQDLIEYALIAGLIGLGTVVTMSTMQHSIANLFSAVSNRLANMT